MRFGLFWQTPGSEESSVARRHWDTIEEDEPAACVERLQCLQEQLPSMYQCILKFNRRGRIPSPRVRESIRLFAEQVMPKLCNVPGAG